MKRGGAIAIVCLVAAIALPFVLLALGAGGHPNVWFEQINLKTNVARSEWKSCVADALRPLEGPDRLIANLRAHRTYEQITFDFKTATSSFLANGEIWFSEPGHYTVRGSSPNGRPGGVELERFKQAHKRVATLIEESCLNKAQRSNPN